MPKGSNLHSQRPEKLKFKLYICFEIHYDTPFPVPMSTTMAAALIPLQKDGRWLGWYYSNIRKRKSTFLFARCIVTYEGFA
jgi:hypothetical protein